MNVTQTHFRKKETNANDLFKTTTLTKLLNSFVLLFIRDSWYLISYNLHKYNVTLH